MIKVLESKAIVVAVLTVVAGIAGYYGLNLPVTTIVGLMTPLMIAIGAAGWSDAVKMKAKMQLDHEVKMHALMHGNTIEVVNGVERDAEGRAMSRRAQAGFIRIGIIALIAGILGVGLLASTLVATNEGCGATPVIKPVITDVVDCVTAEAVVATDGYSILQIASAVWGLIENPANILVAIGNLITKYGPDVVACAIDSYPEAPPTPVTPPGAGSGSGTSAAGSVLMAAKAQHIATKHELLAKFFPGKKINHGKSK